MQSTTRRNAPTRPPSSAVTALTSSNANQSRVHDQRLHGGARVVEALNNPAHRIRTQFDKRLTGSGQWRLAEACRGHVIEANHRNIVWAAHADCPKHSQNTQRHFVVGSDNGVERDLPTDELLYRFLS